jgi:hypothetical protein
MEAGSIKVIQSASIRLFRLFKGVAWTGGVLERLKIAGKVVQL